MNERKLKLYSSTQIPLESGVFSFRVYRKPTEESLIEHVAIFRGDFFSSIEPIFVRVHSECITGEVFSSLRCDCKDQLNLALDKINDLDCGALIYLRGHEGRGIGLGNKVRAYELQNQGFDTIEANEHLGFSNDLRSFDDAGEIMLDLGIKSVLLNTNNPEKISQIKACGIKVVKSVPSLTKPNEYNKEYLRTKHRKLGHSLGAIFS